MRVSLQAARINAGYTQKSAAEKLGISKESLRFYEQYKQSPKIDLAFKIAKLYKCEIGDIIFLKDDIALSD